MSANPLVITQLSHVDPKATPLDINELIDLLNPRLSSVIQGTYIPYVIGHDTPGPNDQNKVWIELDTQQRPIAVKTFWHGSWRRVYNGMLGEIRMFSGDPSNDDIWEISGGTAGKGKPGEIYDGWAICNGNNGTPDLSDKFIIGGHMNNVDHPGYVLADGGWVSWIGNKEGEHEGGQREFKLDEKTTYMNIPKITVGQLKIDTGGEDYDAGGLLYGHPSANPDMNTDIQDEIKNTDPESVSVIPPFIALGFIMFIGYST